MIQATASFFSEYPCRLKKNYVSFSNDGQHSDEVVARCASVSVRLTLAYICGDRLIRRCPKGEGSCASNDVTLPFLLDRRPSRRGIISFSSDSHLVRDNITTTAGSYGDTLARPRP